MKSNLLKNVENDAIDEIKGAYVASLAYRKQMIYLLTTKIEEHFKAQYKRTNYDSGNWAAEQADSMGYCRALGEVLSLLGDEKQQVKEKRGRGRPMKEETNPKPLNQ